MKLVGKIFLIVTGILFAVSALYSFGDATSTIVSYAQSGKALEGQMLVAVIVTYIVGVIELFAGLGGIFRGIGHGPFRGWVPPVAIILFVLFAIEIVTCLATGTALGWLIWTSTGVDVLYFLGWLFTRK